MSLVGPDSRGLSQHEAKATILELTEALNRVRIPTDDEFDAVLELSTILESLIEMLDRGGSPGGALRAAARAVRNYECRIPHLGIARETLRSNGAQQGEGAENL